jgi:hypothetical protein
MVPLPRLMAKRRQVVDGVLVVARRHRRSCAYARVRQLVLSAIWPERDHPSWIGVGDLAEVGPASRSGLCGT